jgi:hypothetical protein
MKILRGPALTAGVLYLEFAIFAAASMWLVVGDIPWTRAEWESWSQISGAHELFLTVFALMVATFLIGGWLTFRRKANWPVLAAGAAVLATSILWNFIATIFLAAAFGLSVAAFLAKNDG